MITGELHQRDRCAVSSASAKGFWLRMQVSHDLKLAKQALGGVLHSIEPFQPT